jgi:hypothetical protein
MISGTEMDFEGNYLNVFTIFAFPQLVEASSVAFLGYTFFKMPVDVAYCFGYTIASVGPAILLTIILKMFR